MEYDAEDVSQQFEAHRIPVFVTWFAEWLLAFGFSRFARWKAGHEGGDAWASWALLPAYEAAIVFKKIGLVTIMVLIGFEVPARFPSEASSAVVAACVAVACFANWVYQFTYVTVLYVLWAPSAGTVTFRRSMGTTFILALVVAVIQFFELAGPFNSVIVHYNAEHNTTTPLWPSFGGEGRLWLTASGPGFDQLPAGSVYANNRPYFWVALAAPIVGVIGMALISCKLLPPPRQIGLVAALLAMFISLELAFFFGAWTSVRGAFGFDPTILFGVVEMPLTYYIMLVDSRYWSSLSLSGDNSTSTLDLLDNEMVGKVALSMRAQHAELSHGTKRPPHLHWTSLQLHKMLSQGAVGKLWSGTVKGAIKALKEIRCDVLDEETVGTVTAEVEVSWLLACNCPRGLIVSFDGFSLNPPYLYVVMELCTRGSLTDMLQTNELNYLQRLGMAWDVTCAVAHMHGLDFLHRDMKSLNCFVTDLDNGQLAVRLGDFGETVTTTAAKGEVPKQVGTMQWMAPEILENWKVGAGKISAEEGSIYESSADVYATTVVLWECLTAQQPFVDARDSATGRKLLGVFLGDAIVAGLRPSTSAIPNGGSGVVSQRMQALVECGWHQDPAARPSAAHISTVIQEEIGNCHVLDQVVATGQDSGESSTQVVVQI